MQLFKGLYEVALLKRLIRAWMLNERTQSPNNITYPVSLTGTYKKAR